MRADVGSRAARLVAALFLYAAQPVAGDVMVDNLLSYVERSRDIFMAGPGDIACKGGFCEDIPYIFYVGNEGGDLDSIVSSVGAAYIRNRGRGAAIHIPIMPFAREDFHLRMDAKMLFDHLEFEMDDETGSPINLIYWDDVQKMWPKWSEARVGLVLCDHNVLDERIAKLLGRKVVGIIDHHFDEGKHLKMPDTFMQMLPAYSKPVLFHHSDPAKPVAPEDEATPDHVWRKILSAGSTTSIVAEEALLLQATEGIIKHQLIVMLLGAIAADTRGFDPKARLYTFIDVYAAKGLLSALQTAEGLPKDTQAFLEVLRSEPEKVDFKNTMKTIEDNFDYSAVPFQIDSVINDPDDDDYDVTSAKVFSFARLARLDVTETLHLFGEHFRDNVEDEEGAQYEDLVDQDVPEGDPVEGGDDPTHSDDPLGIKGELGLNDGFVEYPPPNLDNLKAFKEVADWVDVRFPTGLALAQKVWPTSSLLVPREGAAPKAAAGAAVGQALRSGQLTAAAAVSGASTMGNLASVLLEARADVSHLSCEELLRLDYKDIEVHGLVVGLPGVHMTLGDYLELCGGGRGVAALFTDFMKGRKVDVMLAMTMEAPPATLGRGPAKPGTRGVLALSKSGSRAATWAGALLRDALESCPESLPEFLAERVNFANQRIAAEGFGITWTPVPGGYIHVSADQEPAELFSSPMRASVSRKTIRPFVQHILESNQLERDHKGPWGLIEDVGEKFARWWKKEEAQGARPQCDLDADKKKPKQRRLLLRRTAASRRRLQVQMQIEGARGAAPFGEHHLYQLTTDPSERESAAWYAEWRRTFDCWYLGLPMPTQTQLGGCLGALALHLGSRLDASWRAAQAALGRTPGAAGTPGDAGTPGAAAQSSCEWLEQQQRSFSLPDFPPFPEAPDSNFVLPPVPRLLPSWQHLQQVQASAPRGTPSKAHAAAEHGGEAHTVVPAEGGSDGFGEAATLLLGAGTGFAAGAAIAFAALAWRKRRDGEFFGRLQLRRPAPPVGQPAAAEGAVVATQSGLAMSC